MDDQDQIQEGALDTAGEAMGYDSPEELLPDTSGLAEQELGNVPYARREYEAEKGKTETAFQEVLKQINAAKQRLLAQPTELTRQQYLQGLASKLTTPPERTDPRFYERRNLYTFLRDVGQYGAEQEAAQKAAKIKQAEEVGKLDQLIAKYGFETAQKREAQAATLLGKAREATARTQAVPRDILVEQHYRAVLADPNASADEKAYAKSYLENMVRPKGAKEDPFSDLPPGQAGQNLWARRTLANPKASEPDKKAAQDIITKSTPPDVRKTLTGDKKAMTEYLVRLRNLKQFTVPDIDNAIKMVNKYGRLASGTFAEKFQDIPGIGEFATDLNNALLSIRSRVGFDKMSEMKKLSATGATGLGAVSNAEQQLLQSVYGSLALSSSPTELLRVLQRLKDFYETESDNQLVQSGVSSIDQGLAALSMPDESAESGAPPAPQGGGAAGISRDAIQAELARRRKKQ